MESQDKEYTTAVAKKLIAIDPLLEAEKMTGKSYKNDDETNRLGFVMHIGKNKALDAVLTKLDDVKYRDSITEYTRKMKNYGFELALELPFKSEHCTEHLYIMFHRKNSLLLVFDSYTVTDHDGSYARSGNQVPPPSINGGHIYFNWSPNDGKSNSISGFSGGYIWPNDMRFATMYDENWNEIDQNTLDVPKHVRYSEFDYDFVKMKEYDDSIDLALSKYKYRLVKYGDIDCREAAKMALTEMAQHGKFLQKWKKQPFMWLLHHGDTKDDNYDHEKITAERIAMLPDYVRDAITPA